jgi:hypothetical protein
VNKINHKIYIGKHQTLDPDDDYLGSGKLLNEALQKYGKENFVKEVLFIFDNEVDMNAKEAELVNEEFLARNDVYNLCPGGQGGWGYNNLNSELQRNKAIKGNIVQNNLRKHNLEWKNAEFNRKSASLIKQYVNGNRNPVGWSKSAIINAQSQSAKEKRNKTRKENKFQQGKNNSQYGTMWITNGIENKKIKNIDIIPEGWYKGAKFKRK